MFTRDRSSVGTKYKLSELRSVSCSLPAGAVLEYTACFISVGKKLTWEFFALSCCSYDDAEDGFVTFY